VVAEEEDSAEAGFTAEDLEVVVSTVVALEADISVAAVSISGALPRFTAAVLAEWVAAVAESALAYRAAQVTFQTLPAQDPGSLLLVIHHPDNLSMMDDLIEP
jgi:predicted alpha-1,6-mannanase (GH76 family)